MNYLKNALVLLLVTSALLTVGAKGARRDFVKTHNAYTEHLVLYFGVETALNLRATLLTASMREALKAERTRLMNPTAENAADFASRMDRDLAGYHEIVFSADSPMGADDFGTTDAQWNVRLEADGTVEPLVSIEQIRRPTPIHRALYPHLNQWSDLWIARFERTKKSPRAIKVVFGSGFGNGEITYTPVP